MGQFLLSYLSFLTEERDVGYKWIFSTFKTDRTPKANITNDFQGKVIHMTINRWNKIISNEMFCPELWHEIRHDYTSFGRSAITVFLPLGSSNLLEPYY